MESMIQVGVVNEWRNCRSEGLHVITISVHNWDIVYVECQFCYWHMYVSSTMECILGETPRGNVDTA